MGACEPAAAPPMVHSAYPLAQTKQLRKDRAPPVLLDGRPGSMYQVYIDNFGSITPTLRPASEPIVVELPAVLCDQLLRLSQALSFPTSGRSAVQGLSATSPRRPCQALQR